MMDDGCISFYSDIRQYILYILASLEFVHALNFFASLILLIYYIEPLVLMLIYRNNGIHLLNIHNAAKLCRRFD